MGEARFKVVIDQVHLEKGKELKEVVPLPPQLVLALEALVPRLAHQGKTAAAITAWRALALIYASLRFDDGVHVAPSSLEMSEDAMLGVVWQTNVGRKRRGTRFAVPNCPLSGIEWLKIGGELFQPRIPDRTI
jgi:hypothetical protein